MSSGLYLPLLLPGDGIFSVLSFFSTVSEVVLEGSSAHEDIWRWQVLHHVAPIVGIGRQGKRQCLHWSVDRAWASGGD